MAAFLAEIWVFYESQKAQISARKAAMYSAVMQCFLAESLDENDGPLALGRLMTP